EPDAETIGVERLVQARLVGAPQIKVEHLHQLPGRGQRDDLAAVLEAAALNEPVKDFGRQSSDDVREVRCVEDAIEQGALINGSWCECAALVRRAGAGWYWA